MPARHPIPLPKKLGIKPGHTVCLLNPPDGYMELLAAQIQQVRLVHGLEENADIIHVFTTRKADLESSFPHLKKMLGKPHALWVSWPKRSSMIQSDLNENIIRDIGVRNGLVDVKACPIDDDWSGLKFVYRLRDR